MMKKLFVFLAVILVSGCSIYNNIDRRLAELEKGTAALAYEYSNLDKKVSKLKVDFSSVQKQLHVLPPGKDVPDGAAVLESPFSPEDLAKVMSGGERAVYIRAFTGLTGGTTGKMDKISNADLDDNDLALVFDIGGDYSAGAMLMYYWDEDVDYTEVVPRYIESDTDGGTSGTWILMNGWVSGPLASPSISFYDSDGAGTDEWADLLVGHITMGFDTVTEGAETGDFTISIMMGGSEVNIVDWDATGETLTLGDSSTGEDLVFDFDTATDNEVGVSTNSGVTVINWGSLLHTFAANDIISSEINTIVDSAFWDSGGMTPDGTQCADAAEVTINSGPMQYTIICADNDASTLYGHIVMPDSWDAGTVTFELEYLQTAADTSALNSDISCQCRGATEAVNSTWGTEQAIDDAGVTGSNAVDHTTSAAVTCDGTCVAGDTLYWRWQMDATGTTTAVATLHFLGMKMEYTSNVGD